MSRRLGKLRGPRRFGVGEPPVLLSAVEFDLFSILAKEPLPATALARRIAIDGRGARDFFDALVALELLTRDAEGRYRNSEAADLYLDRGKPSYLGASFAI